MEKLYQIVIIDDDELSGVINELLIRKYDCAEKIVVFDDPQNAIDYFNSLKQHATSETRFPELVLTDFNMPGMNGFEVIKRIKELDLPREVMFCILSASIDRIDDAILEKHHVFKQLIKPLEKKEFMEALAGIQSYAVAG
ncbi:MAG TPA: response regulator [Chitinophagaceae bacterium]|nr:response regulator [Chitinophagaceae bacterium]